MILVVDDEAPVRAMIVRAITELGYRVREAAGGEEALRLVEEERPELVILDYVMPGLDGAEVARRIAAVDPDLPIVFSTGHGALRALRDSAGEDASVLEKPFTLSQLDELIASALASRPRVRLA